MFEDNAPMVRWQQVGESWHDHPMTEALCKRFISGPPVLHCWDTNSERDHYRTPSECQVRSHPGTVQNHAKTVSSIETDQTNNLFRVHNIDGKTQWLKWSSSEPKSNRRSKSSWSATGQNEQERTEMSSFQDPKHQMEHPYSKNTCIQSKSSSFQDHPPQWQEQKLQNKLISRPLIQSISKRVQELNPKYYLPTNEQTQIISEPARALRDWPQEESTEAPLQVSWFNPIYVEPGSIRINSTRDLQTLYPNSFNQIGDMSGEYNIKTDPRVLPVQHRRHKVPIKHKAEIEKELNEMVCQVS